MRPSNAPDKVPGVVVIHENRGLNPYIEDVARRVAIAGFMALAPDGLTSVGGYPGDDEKGAALFKQSRPRQDDGGFFCRRDLAEVTVRLHREKLPSLVSASAVVSPTSWPFGWAPTWRRRCRSTVFQPSAEEAAKIKAPVLAHYAELDTRITSGWPGYDTALSAAHVTHEGYVYAGTNHGFHNDTTPRYDENAAKLAWQRTLNWLNTYLR